MSKTLEQVQCKHTFDDKHKCELVDIARLEVEPTLKHINKAYLNNDRSSK